MSPGFRCIHKVMVGACAALAFSVSLPTQSQEPTDQVALEAGKLARVYGLVEQNFLDGVDPEATIFNGAIRGGLSTLDPFSAFFDRDQFEFLQQQVRGETLGFGSILYVQTGKVVVLQTAQGAPSWRAGLGPGDEIVEVNGTRLRNLDFQSLVELLERARSQPVRLGVIHPGKLISQDYEMKPAEVALPTVDKSFLLSPGVGYVHLVGFELKTPQEVMDAIKALGGNTLKGLLLDLRDNHGGMVDAAVATASLFLKPDLVVLTVRNRAGIAKTARTVEMPEHYGFPLIVLTNGDTASAAEVLTAALQEHDRAVIAGEPTYGKGVVETVMGLSQRTGLALTTAQYFTPSGRSLQRALAGTAFDFAEADTSEWKDRAATRFHTDNNRPVNAGGGVTPDVSIPVAALDPWATFLNQRGFFTTFASEYLTLHGKIAPSFEPSAQVLSDFKDYLTRSAIRSSEEFWSKDQAYVKRRIKEEILTLVFGLAMGDEVQTKQDPQVQKGAALFPRVAAILKGEVERVATQPASP